VTGPGRKPPPGRRPAAPRPKTGPALTARSLARAVLERVEVDGAYANRASSAALDRATALGPEDRGLATELVYGVLRRRRASIARCPRWRPAASTDSTRAC
jgi:16S rRNA (cytosine967-C5)-methyltransferase